MQRSLFRQTTQFRYLMYRSFREVFPFAMIYAWIEVCLHLFLSPNSFIAETTQLSFYFQPSWFRTAEAIGQVSKLLMYFMASYFVATFIRHYLAALEKDFHLPSILGFLTTWLLFAKTGQALDSPLPTQPFWFFLMLTSLGFILMIKFWKFQSQIFSYVGVTLLLLTIYVVSDLLAQFPSSKPEYLIQVIFSNWIGNGPSQLWQVLLWSIAAVFLTVFGFVVPDILVHPYTDLQVVADNLSATLSQSTEKIPHLFTFYTLKDSFAMFGGVGLLLALLIAVLIESRKHPESRYRNLAIWSLVPLIFDQNLPFLLGLPVILQPILILPMLLTTLMAETLGALVLHLGWLSPAVYAVPNGTPSILFGFLASNGDWCYLLVSIIILSLAVLIYLPFVKMAFAKEFLYEKNV